MKISTKPRRVVPSGQEDTWRVDGERGSSMSDIFSLKLGWIYTTGHYIAGDVILYSQKVHNKEMN